MPPITTENKDRSDAAPHRDDVEADRCGFAMGFAARVDDSSSWTLRTSRQSRGCGHCIECCDGKVLREQLMAPAVLELPLSLKSLDARNRARRAMVGYGLGDEWSRSNYNKRHFMCGVEYRSLLGSQDVAPSPLRLRRRLACLSLLQLPRKCTNVDLKRGSKIIPVASAPRVYASEDFFSTTTTSSCKRRRPLASTTLSMDYFLGPWVVDAALQPVPARQQQELCSGGSKHMYKFNKLRSKQQQGQCGAGVTTHFSPPSVLEGSEAGNHSSRARKERVVEAAELLEMRAFVPYARSVT
ncbi:hypothetical protein HOP50_10g60970 [Chloropicon primus]|uniref:Uncharacterized protein n=1 Tax=Chloropicon primus TaxID=1764295 RepID=A0A5B8MS63_9CHLO|nr:hypothetical protein A3770_10p60760 [Chloropicon primus]UPR02770.1 hypothetical protein HOP50_10g60970 [Chloropicon primus]|eukprot:QDZ23558.1 hypothetical protein A3770_10p60760 [Chloropicon primus]